MLLQSCLLLLKRYSIVHKKIENILLALNDVVLESVSGWKHFVLCLCHVTLRNLNLQNQGRGCNVVFIPKKIMLVVYLGVLPQYVTPFLYGNIIVYFFLISKSQASKINANSVVVFKMHNLHPLKRKSNEQDESDDESEGMNWFYAKIRTLFNLFNFLNCTKLEFKNIIMWIMYVITAKMST